MVHLEDAQIDTLDRRDHEMRQIVLGYPVAKIGRKQKRLLAITVNEIAHPTILTKLTAKSDRLLTDQEELPDLRRERPGKTSSGAEVLDHVEQILRGALWTGGTGVNILLHGPPGTGKTEVCRTMAARLGVPLFGVGERDAKGGEPNRMDRLGDLSLVQCLLARDENALLSALIRAVERWPAITVREIERRQMRAVREELDRKYEAHSGLGTEASVPALQAKTSSTVRI